LNEEVEEYVDELAERIVQLGGHAHGTVAEVAKRTPLKAYPSGQRGAEKHLLALSAHLAGLAVITRKGIDSCTEHGDTATADLFTELTRGLDKRLWFVESHLMS
jgi:starvation-inducible DNA-binding protein